VVFYDRRVLPSRIRPIEIEELKISLEVFDEAAHTQAVKIADSTGVNTEDRWHHWKPRLKTERLSTIVPEQ
jgi:hypothetical protein